MGLGLLLVYCVALSSADLQLNVQCGQLYCNPLEYCKESSRVCASCEDICDEVHHNYDRVTCEHNCQNYLHEIQLNGTKSLQAEVDRLQKISSVALTLSCLTVVVLLVAALLKLCSWKNKHNITIDWLRKKINRKKMSPTEKVTVAASGKSELRLEMPVSMPGVGAAVLPTPCTTVTTPGTATTVLSSRRPTEDSTLDYAYDNHAMVGTPSPHSTPGTHPRPHESEL